MQVVVQNHKVCTLLDVPLILLCSMTILMASSGITSGDQNTDRATKRQMEQPEMRLFDKHFLLFFRGDRAALDSDLAYLNRMLSLPFFLVIECNKLSN